MHGFYCYRNFSFYVFKDGKEGAQTNSFLGLLMVGVSLTMDGLTGATQDNLKSKPSTHQLMFSINAWASVQLAVAIILTGEAAHAFYFCYRHPIICFHLFVFCIVSAIGQNFIFMAIVQFSAVSCSVITTTRKFFTILCSVIWFRHPVSWFQWFGVLLVFAGLGWDTYGKYNEPKKDKKSE